VSWRGWLGTAWIFTLILLGLVLAWVLARFALPGEQYVDVGAVTDYPPSPQPYELHDPIHVFLVNDKGTLLVLDPLNAVPGGYLVRWNSQEGYFIDPSRGSWFDLLGRPVTHPRINGWREQQGLPRFPLKIQGDRILVEVSRRVILTVRADVQP
jgi:hypothetical protein